MTWQRERDEVELHSALRDSGVVDKCYRAIVPRQDKLAANAPAQGHRSGSGVGQGKEQEGDADSRGIDFAGSLAQVAQAKAYLAQRHGAVARGAAQRSMQGEVTRKVTSIDVGWR